MTDWHKHIQYILTNFPFQPVVDDFVKHKRPWQSTCQPPTVGHLKTAAEGLLWTTARTGYTYSTGGFTASYKSDGLELSYPALTLAINTFYHEHKKGV